jgi:hypothetical protein
VAPVAVPAVLPTVLQPAKIKRDKNRDKRKSEWAILSSIAKLAIK